MDVLKVSASSNAIATAGALANTIRQQGRAEIQGIGPKAINQAVKAIAISRSYLASSGIDLVTVPGFVDVDVEGQKRTAIRFYVQPRHLLSETEERPWGESDEEREKLHAPMEAQEESTSSGGEEIESERDYAWQEEDENQPPPARESGRFIHNFPHNVERDDLSP